MKRWVSETGYSICVERRPQSTSTVLRYEDQQYVRRFRLGNHARGVADEDEVPERERVREDNCVGCILRQCSNHGVYVGDCIDWSRLVIKKNTRTHR